MSIVKLPKLVRDRVDQIFERCRDKKSTKNSADFMSTVKVFWSCLNNSLSLVDLAGIWAITVSAGEDDGLDSKVFFDFFNGIARLKYPTAVGNEFCSMLLDDLDSDVTYSERLNMHVFDRVLDRNAIHELFKLDSSLKKAYTTFAGDNIINVDGGLTWEEVRGLSLGMEVKRYQLMFRVCPLHLIFYILKLFLVLFVLQRWRVF